MRRIGIDVGGTNTDAVLIEGSDVVAGVKTPTTADVISGVLDALAKLKVSLGGALEQISSVTIGTTHFLNAVVERRRLNKVAAIRVCLPASASLPPFVDWPKDIANEVNGGRYLVHGGHEYDGRPIAPMQDKEIQEVVHKINDQGIRSVAVSAAFSPLSGECEERVRSIIHDINPEIKVTCSHTLGRIGLLERENATILNAALLDLALDATQAFENALLASGVSAPLYISLNDGSVADAKLARQFPVYCFASGATNSMRGAAFLSKISDTIICDVGGTTTDVGCLINGFPREANNVVTIGGVRTLFRMPDILSIGLGGGTRVRTAPLTVGPDSVGYRITEDALVFGGDVLTLTDIAVKARLMEVGDTRKLTQIDNELVQQALQYIEKKIALTVDRMKTEAKDVSLIAVGGGAPLIPKKLSGVREVLQVPHAEVANAVGAALAQISGETDQVYQGLSRSDVLNRAEEQARERAVAAGADENSLKVVEMEDIPIAYLPGHAIRARVRVVGDVRAHL
ncbi:hydantoinase/oxoprolinase family protein [Sneathiella sp. P13V-1]|uniref:hydantoinase/oxoprolinase N-terminal domain-containing protein n=1 Tax=Sneathiella sp. P13V-1 TaxID=2697366 RepID=UPI00187BA698|nr:hydantoinase/oxoprolinase family protein [Sneathiella sp. P13V-1]MBE7637093.1 hydantoinase/oxoprolinase family protein [Sneathiella sp. P13V-1]